MSVLSESYKLLKETGMTDEEVIAHLSAIEKKMQDHCVSKIDFEKRMIGIDQNFINLEKSLHRSILFVISSLSALMTILKFIKT
jgi:hypothetical protein